MKRLKADLNVFDRILLSYNRASSVSEPSTFLYFLETREIAKTPAIFSINNFDIYINNNITITRGNSQMRLRKSEIQGQ